MLLSIKPFGLMILSITLTCVMTLGIMKLKINDIGHKDS